MGKQLPLMSQQICAIGGQGFGLQDVTCCQPAGQGAMFTQLPVAGSQQPGTTHGFGLQVVPVMVVPLHGVPGTHGKQLPAASQQTPCGGGQGFGLQTVPGTIVDPAGQPAVEKITHDPVTGSQQSWFVGLQGFGLHVLPGAS